MPTKPKAILAHLLPGVVSTPTFLEKLQEALKLVKDNWSLCEFTGESETMMAQTLHASKINLKNHGFAFSFRGNNCLSAMQGGGLVENARSYAKILGMQYIQETEVDPGLFPDTADDDNIYVAEKGPRKGLSCLCLLTLTEAGLDAMIHHVKHQRAKHAVA